MKFNPTTDKHAFNARDRPHDVFDLLDHVLGAVDARRLPEVAAWRTMAPWSSSGKKPCGVLLNSKAAAASVPTTTATPTIATRASRRTTAT